MKIIPTAATNHQQTRQRGISVIIPCLNEEYNLAAVLRLLQTAATDYVGLWQVIVVDGGSQDGTCAVAQTYPWVSLLHSSACRASQLNIGATAADYDVLYFVHADTRPPLSCFRDVASATASGVQMGGYAFQFDSDRQILRFNSYMTTFNVTATRGGDQTIFMCAELFEQLDGYDESWVIMEEYDLMVRARELGIKYALLKGNTLVSDRKYEGRSWLRVQLANVRAMAMWRSGCSPAAIRDRYNWMLDFGKSISNGN